jgi:hypothetical protein
MSQQPGFQGGSAGVNSYQGSNPNGAIDVNQAAIMSNQNRMKNMNMNDLKAKMMEQNEVDMQVW